MAPRKQRRPAAQARGAAPSARQHEDPAESLRREILQPAERWRDQFHTRPLDDSLALLVDALSSLPATLPELSYHRERHPEFDTWDAARQQAWLDAPWRARLDAVLPFFATVLQPFLSVHGAAYERRLDELGIDRVLEPADARECRRWPGKRHSYVTTRFTTDALYVPPETVRVHLSRLRWLHVCPVLCEDCKRDALREIDEIEARGRARDEQAQAERRAHVDRIVAEIPSAYPRHVVTVLRAAGKPLRTGEIVERLLRLTEALPGCGGGDRRAQDRITTKGLEKPLAALVKRGVLRHTRNVGYELVE